MDILPEQLVIMLKTVLSNNYVSSRRFQGKFGMNICLFLNFEANDTAAACATNITSRQYRTKPPCSIRRDMARQHDRYGNNYWHSRGNLNQNIDNGNVGNNGNDVHSSDSAYQSRVLSTDVSAVEHLDQGIHTEDIKGIPGAAEDTEQNTLCNIATPVFSTPCKDISNSKHFPKESISSPDGVIENKQAVMHSVSLQTCDRIPLVDHEVQCHISAAVKDIQTERVNIKPHIKMCRKKVQTQRQPFGVSYVQTDRNIMNDAESQTSTSQTHHKCNMTDNVTSCHKHVATNSQDLHSRHMQTVHVVKHKGTQYKEPRQTQPVETS